MHTVWQLRSERQLSFRAFSQRRLPPSRRRKPNGSDKVFAAGQVVSESGIYEAVHKGDHRFAHEIVMLRGHIFPYCDQCGDRVRFKMVHMAPYIFDDEDFEDQQ